MKFFQDGGDELTHAVEKAISRKQQFGLHDTVCNYLTRIKFIANKKRGKKFSHSPDFYIHPYLQFTCEVCSDSLEMTCAVVVL